MLCDDRAVEVLERGCGEGGGDGGLLWCVVQRDGELATDTKQGDWRVLVGCILTFGFTCRVSGPE